MFWFDFFIIVIILMYAFDGYRQGFIKTTVDILGVALSLFVALKYYAFAGALFVSWGLDRNLSTPVGFFVLWIIVQLLIYLLTTLLFHFLPQLMQNNKTTRTLGILPGLIKGVMITAIFLIILMTLPFSTKFKDNLSTSILSGALIKSTAQIENQMAGIFGQLNNSLTLYSIPTDKDEVTQLNFKTSNYTLSETDEKKMLEQVNAERAKVGLKALQSDTLLRNVARAYAIEMARNGFFAHTTPTGQTPFDRLAAAGVTFTVAGENLALAPSTDLAHVGLMNSKEHRENILDSTYTRVGVGVIDLGPYGKMFVQEFAG